MWYRVLFISLSSIILFSCGTSRKPYYSDTAETWQLQEPDGQNKLIHTLYLIGDAGELDDTIQQRNYVLDAAATLLSQETEETSLVYLGDNVYPRGLPKKDDRDREMAERTLDAQLSVSQAHQGMTYFIPGNHDWNRHQSGGRKAILRQADYIKDHQLAAQNKIKFYPKDACADPQVVEINRKLVYVFLDSQWWLQDWEGEKKMNRKCDVQSRADLLKRIEEIFVQYKNDEIVVMLHHPIKSSGKHGGNFSLKHHLFPLTEIKQNLWIPLPIIGSLYPIFRNVTGSKQDITHIKNQELMQGLDGVAKRLRINVTFASGHDHGLQYFDSDRIKYIVSGGGSRRDYTQRGGDASYARDARGFAKVNFYENSESWLEMYTVAGFGQTPILEYRTQLRQPRAGTVPEQQRYPPVTEKYKTVAASSSFGAGPIKRAFLGPQYRDIWATPVKAEIIDLETKLGGLTPIKKGGGMASNSLRMERENKQQYILRSIKKDYTKVIPPEFQNLKLVDVIADQNSASHPYNALVIHTLSQAAGIFYTDPKLVYLQHQAGLGNYNSQFPEELYLLEERPAGDWSDAAQFGHTSKIISYADLIDVLTTKKNQYVDQKWVLRSRVFDLLIHDWDRHDDQWRWAKFQEGDKNVYRPIPRDRDQAFYKFKGVVPWYISTFMLKQFKTMKKDVKAVKHLAFNARHFDRYFLHELSWPQWEVQIRQLQAAITDEVIDAAMLQFPPEIRRMSDVSELAETLRARRDNLLDISRRLYDFLSKEVEISGTDDADRFEVDQRADGSVIIRHYVLRKKKGDLLRYERRFYPSETKEIRLYGLRGKDQFIIFGVDQQAIKLRAIGGEGDDTLENQTQKKVSVYDELDGMSWTGPVSDMTSDVLGNNEYDRHGYQYNTSLPGINLGYSVDDGVWIGGSYAWTNHGWRKEPYQSKQKLSLSVAPGSRNTLLFSYQAHFPAGIGSLDFAPQVEVNFPYYENNFGLGGSSENPGRELEYNWVRMKHVNVSPLIRLKSGKSIRLDLGPTYRYRDISSTPGRVVEDESELFTPNALASRHYAGAMLDFEVGFVDRPNFPSNGFVFSADAVHIRELSKDETVTEYNVQTQSYIQLLTRPKLILAHSFGYMRSYGDRQFYQYPALGNDRGLRGYRNQRYRGNATVYNQIDLRMKLIGWQNNILPMDIGVVAGYDVGRVYFDEEIDEPWSSSQTIGLWFDLLGTMVLQPYYSLTEEENTFTFRLGFHF